MAVSSPTQLERTEQGWKITERGQVSFSPTQSAELNAVIPTLTPTQTERTEATARATAEGVEKQAIVKVDEAEPKAGARGQAEAVKSALNASGAKTGEIQSTTDEQGIRHSEMKISYRTDQPEIAKVSNTLDAVAKQTGNKVLEHSSDCTERREISKGYEIAQPQRTAAITR